MTEKLGQEPAFPLPMEVIDRMPTLNINPLGISKRFYAACAAMQGILAGNVDIPVPNYVAELSYKFADEILKQENL